MSSDVESLLFYPSTLERNPRLRRDPEVSTSGNFTESHTGRPMSLESSNGLRQSLPTGLDRTPVPNEFLGCYGPRQRRVSLKSRVTYGKPDITTKIATEERKFRIVSEGSSTGYVLKEIFNILLCMY